MVVNRVGDLGLAIGMFLILIGFGSLDFPTVFALVPSIANSSPLLLDAIGFCIIIGAVGKSAQIGLHT